MKRMKSVGICLAVCFLIAAAAKPATEQSQNLRAMRWFEIGATEKDPQKKIEAYKKAIELDPLFVEALLNLGLVYKEQRDYARAEQYLLQAYSAKPDKIKANLKSAILYELATVYNRLGKLQNYEETLRQARRFAADQKMGATIAFELGRFLYQQGRYEEALAELREGQKLYPANQDFFTNLIQLAESAVAAQRLYATAERLQASGKLRDAKAVLEQIRAQSPEDKNVAAKIAALEAQLETEAKQSAVAALYEQAQKYEAEGKLELALAAYENLLQQSGNYKDANLKLQRTRQQLEQKQLDEKLENAYAAGVAALTARDWARSILAFEKVVEMDRNFRDAQRRLREAQEALERESTETITARYYAEGVDAMNRNDLGAALAALEKVHRINPNYRDTATLLAEVENALQSKKASTAGPVVFAVSPPNLDSLYQTAMTAFAQKDWMQAVVNFEKIQLLQPNYREVISHLAEARAHLHASEPAEIAATQQDRGSLSLYLGGSLIVLSILLGAAVFLPMVRARVYMLRGNYAAAALLYESMLTRHPYRMKLYSALANIYLLLGRSDEQALKVFKTVLQLNLATRQRDEIAAIVGQNYLQEGRTDSDAIEVLESALQAERRK